MVLQNKKKTRRWWWIVGVCPNGLRNDRDGKPEIIGKWAIIMLNRKFQSFQFNNVGQQTNQLNAIHPNDPHRGKVTFHVPFQFEMLTNTCISLSGFIV